MTAALWLSAGLAMGTAHFVLLRWNTRLYLNDGKLAQAMLLQGLRLATTAAVLGFAASHGAWPLFFAALGVVSARLLVLRVTQAMR